MQTTYPNPFARKAKKVRKFKPCCPKMNRYEMEEMRQTVKDCEAERKDGLSTCTNKKIEEAIQKFQKSPVSDKPEHPCYSEVYAILRREFKRRLEYGIVIAK